MDYAMCNVIYVDRRAAENKCIKRNPAMPDSISSNAHELPKHDAPVGDDSIHVHRNVQTLLETFSEGEHRKLP
jgi:hypothetical protein